MIFLDFDGVLVDSNNETLGNLEYTLKEVYGKKLSQETLDTIKAQVKLRRGEIGPISDFFKITKEIIKENNFHPKIKSYSENDLVDIFLGHRNLISSKFKAQWVELHRQTILLEKIICLDIPYIIVSTKDEESLSMLCKSFNLKPKKIFGKKKFEEMQTKEKLILNELDINCYQNNIFIDDNYDHLFFSDRVSCYFASWGYEHPSQNSLFKNISIQDAISLIKKS